MSQEIRRAAESLIDADVLSWDRVVSLKPLQTSMDFNAVALDDSSSYEQVYLKGLELKYFNFFLNDQSFIQLTPSTASARFAYYPNPFTDPDGLLSLLDDPLDFDAVSIADLGATAGRAPLRYDYSEGQYVEIEHPCAHFHLGHGELGRLASSRIYCPKSFCLLILRLYYAKEWEAFASQIKLQSGYSNSLDEKLMAVLTENGPVNVTFFSELEGRFVHLT